MGASHPKGVVARAYGVYPEHKDKSNQALFVIDEQGTIRWSRAYPDVVNPRVDGVLCALELMRAAEDATLRQSDEEGHA
jgi:alkyl hydroperoxide reductase subunit AhpC